MSWIKRNLLFAISGIVSLVLLALAGFYNFNSYRHNAAAFDKLNEIYGTLKNIAAQQLSWGNNKIDNIQTAKEQEKQLREWIKQTSDNFQPIEPVPALKEVSSETFAAALRRSIDQLQHEAERADVTVPPKYAFSFEAQRSLVKFAPGSLALLATQLGEVKTISEVFFAARVNSLDSIQRVRVSDDDAGAQQGDYFDDHSVTNGLAVLTPYTVTFRCFSAELGSVLDALAASPHGFVVQALNVSPAGASGGGGPGGPEGNPNYFQAPPAMMQPQPPQQAGRGGMTTVLKEQLLRVTMEIKIVKLKK